MTQSLPPIGTDFEEIEILPATVTAIFRDNENVAFDPGLLPFFLAATLYLVELSFDGGERQGLWMGSDAKAARQCASEWAAKLRVRIVDRTDKGAMH